MNLEKNACTVGNKKRLSSKKTAFWWYLQGSNQGHMDFQSIALPSELRYRANAGANIEPFLIYPKEILKKINSYLRIVKNKL